MKIDEAVKNYEDYQGSIALAKNPEIHKRTKHIDIWYHFVRKKVAEGIVVLEYCSTKSMKVDLMPKPIPQLVSASTEHAGCYGAKFCRGE